MSIENSPFSRIKKPLKSDMNVVPYIDVMLVLLVIFMVTAPMLTTGVEVNLPQAQAETITTKQDVPVIISLKADGELFISTEEKNDEPVTKEALIDKLYALQKEKPNLGVLINADKSNPYGQVMVLMSVLKQAGIKQVGLLTENPDSSN